MVDVDMEVVNALQSRLAKEDAAIASLRGLLEDEQYKTAMGIRKILEAIVSFREDTADQIKAEMGERDEEEAA